MMKLHVPVALFLSISWAVFAFASAHSHHSHPEKDFLHCLESSDDATITKIIYKPNDPDFISVLNFYIQNSRFMNNTHEPRLIVAPFKESQVQTVIKCGKSSGLQVRVRSGGHDFEGSSYMSDVPFFILDINKFRSISIDNKSKTIWFGAGATLGEIYYAIYRKNSSLGVALGNWPTVSVGGFLSGGGYGGLTRQYGMGADQVIDAVVVDANGEIHDSKSSMGEDFFWAIRGGIGANFGVILSYKLRLVDVPVKVASFFVNRTLEENAIQLAYKWQQLTHKLPLDLAFSVQFSAVISKQTGKPTAQAAFVCTYRCGGVDELLSIMDKSFPELGVTKEDIFEMLWIQYVPFHNIYPIDDYVHYLTSRIPPSKPYFKAKSDFVKSPIPESGIEVLMRKLLEVPIGKSQTEWTYWGGGIMDQIPPSEIAFPHRGYLYVVFEVVYWNKADTPSKVEERINWLREFHSEMGHFVPSNPRPAYANYRDHDLGLNNPDGTTTVEEARTTWGGPNFGINFDRLVRVKSQVDPTNYFKNEQSLPLQSSTAYSPSEEALECFENQLENKVCYSL